MCDTQSEEDCKDDVIGMGGPLVLRWSNVINCPGDPPGTKVQMVIWTCPCLRSYERYKCFHFQESSDER